MRTRHKTLDELAEAVTTALDDLDPPGQRLAIGLYQLLTGGQPVTALTARQMGRQGDDSDLTWQPCDPVAGYSGDVCAVG